MKGKKCYFWDNVSCKLQIVVIFCSTASWIMQAWRGVQEKQISGGLPLPRMPRPVRSSLFGTAME